MKQKKKTNKNRLIIYNLIILFLVLIVWMVNPFNKKKEEKTLVNCKIEYIRCQIGSKGSRSLIKVNFNNKLYNIPITKSRCKNLNKGDTIQLVYVKNKDKILLE